MQFFLEMLEEEYSDNATAGDFESAVTIERCERLAENGDNSNLEHTFMPCKFKHNTIYTAFLHWIST